MPKSVSAQGASERPEDRIVGNPAECKDDARSDKLMPSPLLDAAFDLRGCRVVLGRKALDGIRDSNIQRTILRVQASGRAQSRTEPGSRPITDERNARSVGSETAGGQAKNQKPGILRSDAGHGTIVPVGVGEPQLIEVSREPATRAAVEECRHWSAPPQLEPAPAVQPRQWVPVWMEEGTSSSKLSMDHMSCTSDMSSI